MNLFEGLVLNFVFIIFPMLLYLFYLVQTSNTGKKEYDLFLDFVLIYSLWNAIFPNVDDVFYNHSSFFGISKTSYCLCFYL